MSLITFDNFYEEVKLFCHGQPKKSDGLGIIVSDPNSDMAKVWIGYAQAKGWDHRAKMWAQMLKSGCKLTMPCANPRHFDPAFMPVPREAEYRELNDDANARRSIAQQIRDVVAKSRPRDKRRPDNEIEEAPKTQAEIEAEFKSRAISDPPMLSPRLADHLGIKPPAHSDAVE